MAKFLNYVTGVSKENWHILQLD